MAVAAGVKENKLLITRVIAVDPFDIIVFGASGDLSRRKLLPALYHRDLNGQLPDEARIIGVSRRPNSHEEFRAWAGDAIRASLGKSKPDTAGLKKFCDRLYYVPVDVGADNGWNDLAEILKEGENRIRVCYLATSPELFTVIARQLGKRKLVTPLTRLVVEKPIGRDLASAKDVNDTIGSVFLESNIYRIDHYLGKETVQNLMALRFANALFEPLWNSRYIDNVQITVAENIGVEGRGAYYDTAGALRDMVQNHMLQLLCLVAIETPVSLEADAVRDEKLKVLKALQPINEDNAALLTVRGQYRAGATAGGPVPGYLEELKADSSSTETFAAIRAEIGNWRWSGVPFYLRTGKRLPSRVSEIVVTFRSVPHSVFENTAGAITPNRLVIRLQPDEGVKLWLMIKDPGPGGMRLRHVPLDMSFAEAFKVRNADAYERLVMDVVRGNQTLFMRRDEVEAAWSWAEPILNAWQNSEDGPKGYTAGTWGPSAAIALIERDGRTWHEDD